MTTETQTQIETEQWMVDEFVEAVREDGDVDEAGETQEQVIVFLSESYDPIESTETLNRLEALASSWGLVCTSIGDALVFEREDKDGDYKCGTITVEGNSSDEDVDVDIDDDIPMHDEIGLADKKFRCGHCGEVVEKARWVEIEDAVGQHITYHCDVVGLVN